MMCWSTKEHPETALGLVNEGSDVLSMSVQTLAMSCAEAVDALAPQTGDMKPDNLLSQLHLICDFRK